MYIMTQQNAARFFKAVKQNEALQARLKAITDPDAFINVAAEHGFSFQKEDLKTELSKLSEEEVAAVCNPGIGPRLHIVPR